MYLIMFVTYNSTDGSLTTFHFARWHTATCVGIVMHRILLGTFMQLHKVCIVYNNISQFLRVLLVWNGMYNTMNWAKFTDYKSCGHSTFFWMIDLLCMSMPLSIMLFLLCALCRSCGGTVRIKYTIRLHMLISIRSKYQAFLVQTSLWCLASWHSPSGAPRAVLEVHHRLLISLLLLFTYSTMYVMH